MESGQCDCRRHLIGRQCSEVQPGFFCAPLDYYRYEAEDATGHSPGDSALSVSARLSATHSAHIFMSVSRLTFCATTAASLNGLLLYGALKSA